MPEFFDVIKSRRSVRSYASEPVSTEDLQELIELAVLAPTGMNMQPWAFTIVTNRDVLTTLNAKVLEVLRTPEMQRVFQQEGMADFINDPAYSIFYGAPALVVISGKTSTPIASTDCQLAAENLFLAAHAKGLGTCYMGFLLFLARDARVTRELLRIPEGYEMMAAAVVGHPASHPDGPPLRNPPRIEWVR
jgi:nitroreductase